MKFLQNPEHPRLATRLAVALLIALTTVMVLATIAAVLTAYFEAGDTQDETLLSVAHLVETNQISTRYDKSLIRDNDYDDGVLVWQLGDSSHSKIPIKSSISTGYHTLKAGKNIWRVYVTSNPQSGNRYAVVQKLSVKTEAAKNNAMNTALPLLGLLLIIPLLIFFVVRYSFKPLNKLGNEIDGNNPRELNLPKGSEIPLEVVPFVQSIDSLLQKNAEYNQRQTRFIADAAHELRTPITALSLEIENLNNAKDAATRLSRQSALSKSISRLQRLVNQLLDLARVQSHSERTTTTINLNDLVKNQIADFILMAERKNIQLVMEKNEQALLDDVNHQLQHLTRNALSNAIKYTPDEGMVTISIYKTNKWVNFSVVNSGAGVAERHLDKLHEPFYRPIEQATSDGAGLGLTICHEIANELQGTLSLKNLPQRGFQFLYKQIEASK